MIGIVVIGHGNIGKEYVEGLENVVGPQKSISHVAVNADSDMDAVRAELQREVERVESGQGVIICADYFGGTPSNLAISCMEADKVEVIAGVNLPMLIKIAGVRVDHSLGEVLAQAAEAGRRYITVASYVLRDGKPQRNKELGDISALRLLVSSLMNQIENELSRLNANIPNDTEKLSLHNNVVDFLGKVFSSLVQIADHLETALVNNNSKSDIERSAIAFDGLKSELDIWWQNNKTSAVDWCIRFPAIGGVIGMLRFAGAEPTMATAVAVAGIGGPKLIKSIQDYRKGSK